MSARLIALADAADASCGWCAGQRTECFLEDDRRKWNWIHRWPNGNEGDCGAHRVREIVEQEHKGLGGLRTIEWRQAKERQPDAGSGEGGEGGGVTDGARPDLGDAAVREAPVQGGLSGERPQQAQAAELAHQTRNPSTTISSPAGIAELEAVMGKSPPQPFVNSDRTSSPAAAQYETMKRDRTEAIKRAQQKLGGDVGVFELMPALEAWRDEEISGGKLRECIVDWINGTDFSKPENRPWEKSVVKL